MAPHIRGWSTSYCNICDSLVFVGW